MPRIIRDGVPRDEQTRQSQNKFEDALNQLIDERNEDLRKKGASADVAGPGSLLVTFNDLDGTAAVETTIWTADDDYTVTRAVVQLSEVDGWLSEPTMGIRVTPPGGAAADLYAAAALSTGGNPVDEAGEKYVFTQSGFQPNVQAGHELSANVTVAGTVGAGGKQLFRVLVFGYKNQA